MDTKNNTIKKQIEQLKAEVTNLTNNSVDREVRKSLECWLDALDWVLSLNKSD